MSTNCCSSRVDAAWAKNPNLLGRKNDPVSSITSLAVTRLTNLSCQEQSRAGGAEDVGGTGGAISSPECFQDKSSESSSLYSPTPNAPPTPEPHPTPPAPPIPPPQPNPAPTNSLGGSQQRNEPPQLEGQPTDNFPGTSPTQVERRLKTPPEIDYAERRERLLRRLQEKKQLPSETNSHGELGNLFLRPRQLEQLPNPPLAPPVVQSKPVGYLLTHVGYFQTSNIFSSVAPIQDGLIFSGLTLASAPLPLGSKTYLNASIDGNLIRYINQSKYNYSQIRFNLDIYQQLTPRMYGDFGWSNQQLFYARDSASSNFRAGDRFLSENSLRLSLGRRDPLTPKLMLDSFYELRLSFTDPPSGRDSRNRIINSLWVSLNYYWQKSLQVGLDYQFGLSNFTERQREDQYHRLFGHLTYGTSNYSNISLEGGVSLGGSTERNIDFNSWFFTLNYNFELGRF